MIPHSPALRPPVPDHRPVARHLLHAVRFPGPDPGASRLDPGDAAALLWLAQYEEVESWLWHQVQAGRLSLPPEQTTTLRTRFRGQTALGLQLGAAATSTVGLLAKHRIASVLLKGAACLALAERHPFLALRSTGDVDLLVEPGASERSWHLLQAHGYVRRSAEPSVHPDHHHLPPLIGPAQVSVEIHESASILLDPTESWHRFGEASVAVSWQGTTVPVPPTEALLWHTIAHALGDAARGCRLRSFLTAAAILTFATEEEVHGALRRLDREGLRFHDARHRVPRGGIERWLAAAAWLAGRSFHDRPRRHGNPEGDLLRLIGYRHRCLARVAAGTLPQQRANRQMEEGALAQFGLGLNRLGHWAPRHLRPRRLLSSLWYKLCYLRTRGPAR